MDVRRQPGVPGAASRSKLRAISGHRDTGYTSCPGGALYARLPDIARAVAATGLPKLYAPHGAGRARRAGAVHRPTLRARGLDRDRAERRRCPRRARPRYRDGGRLDVERRPDPATGSYTWTIEAGPQTRPASGTIGKAPPPARPPLRLVLTGLTVTPPVISPDGDGIDDALAISYSLGGPRRRDRDREGRDRAPWSRRSSPTRCRARVASRSRTARRVADGSYTLSVSAVSDGRSHRPARGAVLDRPHAVGTRADDSRADAERRRGRRHARDRRSPWRPAPNVTVQIEQAGSLRRCRCSPVCCRPARRRSSGTARRRPGSLRPERTTRSCSSTACTGGLATPRRSRVSG